MRKPWDQRKRDLALQTIKDAPNSVTLQRVKSYLLRHEISREELESLNAEIAKRSSTLSMGKPGPRKMRRR